MLTKNQWQWLADHHQKVRNYCILGIVLAVSWYVFMIVQMMFDTGKGSYPNFYTPSTNFFDKFSCSDDFGDFMGRTRGGAIPPRYGYYEDANNWLLQAHQTVMFDERMLLETPECLGAILADNSNSPVHEVYIIYNTKMHKPIYRIARIDDVVKR